MSKLERIDLEPAFVLHARPWREASLIVEAFSRVHGRLGLVVRGARRPKSRIHGLLQPFIPLLLSWRGRGELATLTGVEAEGGALPLAGSAAIVGFYLNELLLRFVHRHDPEPRLFDHYRATLGRVACEDDPEPALRIFEKRLLEAAGYALELEARNGFRRGDRTGRVVSIHRGDRTETPIERCTPRGVCERIDAARPRSRAAHRSPHSQGSQAAHAFDH